MDNEIVDLFCNFLEIFPNLKAEAFNLVAVIYGFRAAYVYKYNNYKKELGKYRRIKDYICNLTYQHLNYHSIDEIDNPKLVIYNTIEIEKKPHLITYLENIMNHENMNISMNYLLEHLCPNQYLNHRAIIEFYIKNYNSVFYKEYCTQIPENDMILAKKTQFEQLAEKLNLQIEIRIIRCIPDDDILTIILNKKRNQYIMYKNDLIKFFKKNSLQYTSSIIEKMTLDNSYEMMKKYHRKIGILSTIISFQLYSLYKPLNTLEKALITREIHNMEKIIYSMDIENISTNRVSIIVLSYIQNIIDLLHHLRNNDEMYEICKDNIETISKQFSNNIETIYNS